MSRYPDNDADDLDEDEDPDEADMDDDDESAEEEVGWSEETPSRAPMLWIIVVAAVIVAMLAWALRAAF